MRLIKAFGSILAGILIFSLGGYVHIPVILGYCFFILSIAIGAYALNQFSQYIKEDENEKENSNRH